MKLRRKTASAQLFSHVAVAVIVNGGGKDGGVGVGGYSIIGSKVTITSKESE